MKLLFIHEPCVIRELLLRPSSNSLVSYCSIASIHWQVSGQNTTIKQLNISVRSIGSSGSEWGHVSNKKLVYLQLWPKVDGQFWSKRLY